jgi:hypothetical protein
MRSEYENERTRASVVSAPRIFISYPRENASDANEIRRLLTLAGFEPWMDVSDLLAGEAWEKRLVEAIRTSDFVLALLSEHSAGGYQETELRVAAENAPQDRDGQVPFIVPCLTHPDTAIPAFLDQTHVVKLMQGSWRVLHELLCAAARSAGLRVPTLLRSAPRNDLTDAAATQMIVEKNFFEHTRHTSGRPAADDYVTYFAGMVTDQVTGRQWTATCGGPLPLVGQVSAMTMVAQANEQRLGGSDDWRLPTLDESMSLMARHKNARRLFLSAHFSDESYALACDTCPRAGQTFVWVVSYIHGECQTVPADSPWPVRLVRTTWEHLK